MKTLSTYYYTRWWDTLKKTCLNEIAGGGRDPEVVDDVGGGEVVHLVVEHDPGARRQHKGTETEYERNGNEKLSRLLFGGGRMISDGCKIFRCFLGHRLKDEMMMMMDKVLRNAILNAQLLYNWPLSLLPRSFHPFLIPIPVCRTMQHGAHLQVCWDTCHLFIGENRVETPQSKMVGRKISTEYLVKVKGFVEIILDLSKLFWVCRRDLSGVAVSLCVSSFEWAWNGYSGALHTNNRLLLQWTKFVNPSARISVFTSSGGYPGGGINRFRPRSLEIVFISQQMPFKLDTD